MFYKLITSYCNGKLHRTDGPAIEWDDGYKAWCLNGQFHRLDGPAIEYPDGRKKYIITNHELNYLSSNITFVLDILLLFTSN